MVLLFMITHDDGNVLSWQAGLDKGQIPGGRAGHASTLLPPRHMLILGGADENMFCNDPYLLQLPSTIVVGGHVELHWTQLTTLVSASNEHFPMGRSYHTVHFLPGSQGRCLVLGNILTSSKHGVQFRTNHFRVDLIEVSVERRLIEWKKAPPMSKGSWAPSARYGHCSAVRTS